LSPTPSLCGSARRDVVVLAETYDHTFSRHRERPQLIPCIRATRSRAFMIHIPLTWPKFDLKSSLKITARYHHRQPRRDVEAANSKMNEIVNITTASSPSPSFTSRFSRPTSPASSHTTGMIRSSSAGPAKPKRKGMLLFSFVCLLVLLHCSRVMDLRRIVVDRNKAKQDSLLLPY
jgi:hypothetical protein